MTETAPTIRDVQELLESLGEQVERTPLVRCAGIESRLGDDTQVFGKLEFLQRTGTFKARGALSVLKSLDAEQRDAGVTAVSAGNHAIAVAYAARATGTHAKVVMTASANPARMQLAREYGAELVIADDVHAAFEAAERIRNVEGRFLVHPFEGKAIATGTGTVGLEICEQLDQFDAIVASIGGGGFIGGVANAVKQLNPGCEVIGVEPHGANSMHLSFEAGEPRSIDKVRTIADSLGAPFAMPYSFALCRDNVDRLVEVSDQQIREAMGFLFHHMKIAVEPACAAVAAALLGPLRAAVSGKRVVLLFCGSNIDWATFETQAILENNNVAR